ncbi:MAG: beta-N-acetylhexosaminidase [Armatimonadetes bacterium]|nr:beta-N-acetylhexosaminidase [Armatimonadota bacterium]
MDQPVSGHRGAGRQHRSALRICLQDAHHCRRDHGALARGHVSEPRRVAGDPVGVLPQGPPRRRRLGAAAYPGAGRGAGSGAGVGPAVSCARYDYGLRGSVWHGPVDPGVAGHGHNRVGCGHSVVRLAGARAGSPPGARKRPVRRPTWKECTVLRVKFLPGIVPLAVLTAALTACTQPGQRTSLTKTHPREPSIIPRPASLELADGQFVLSSSTTIALDRDDPHVRAVAQALAQVISRSTGLALPIRVEKAGDSAVRCIRLSLTPGDQTLGPEDYALTIESAGIMLRGAEARGLFWGVQTLRQLLPPEQNEHAASRADEATLPALRIVDRPRYPWRGMHLDVCRHMLPVDFVKRYIDLLALHKLNTFHWHLTEDQGWRIEIKKYPRLTEVGAWRTEADGQRHGGFYTQDEVREIVAYAAARFITVVPEIEMPGHALAALASYPELSCTGGPFEVSAKWGVFDDVYCAGNDQTFAFLEDVLSEVLELFPGQYIHIGGDECPKARWKACPKCQARIQMEGLANEGELQSYFIKRVARFLEREGRRLVGWDEILEGGLAPSATVMSWRGLVGGIAAARMGHDVVMTPTAHCYFNYAQTATPGEPGHPHGQVVTLRDVYAYEPTPAELTPAQARHVLGAQGNVWTEFIQTPKDVEYMAFPRLCALAEATWTPPQRRDWTDFQLRLEAHRRRLDALHVAYCPVAWSENP